MPVARSTIPCDSSVASSRHAVLRLMPHLLGELGHRRGMVARSDGRQQVQGAVDRLHRLGRARRPVERSGGFIANSLTAASVRLLASSHDSRWLFT